MPEKDNGVYNKLGFFDEIRLLSQNPLGRELAWDYVRENFKKIIDDYGEDDARLGQMIIDISRTFENEFLFFELLRFVFTTETGAAANARFLAIEIVSTNVVWILDKEDDIIKGFSGSRGISRKNYASQTLSSKKSTIIDKSERIVQFKAKARNMLQKFKHEKPEVYAVIVGKRL